MQHHHKLDDKVVKCTFVGYSDESKGYKLYHLQSKPILISRDVVFVEDAVQPLLSCTKQTGISSQDVFDTLLPLFTGGTSNVSPNEAHVHPTQGSNDITDQPICDADLQHVIDKDMAKNEHTRNMPRWLVQTLRDSKLDAPLSTRTRSGFQPCPHQLHVVNLHHKWADL